MKSAGNSRIAVGRRIIHGDAEIDFHHVGPDVIDELRPRVVPAVVPAGAVDARGVDVEHFRRAIAIAVADTFVVATIVERRHEPLRSISNVVVVFDLRVNDGNDPRDLVGNSGPSQSKCGTLPPPRIIAPQGSTGITRDPRLRRVGIDQPPYRRLERANLLAFRPLDLVYGDDQAEIVEVRHRAEIDRRLVPRGGHALPHGGGSVHRDPSPRGRHARYLVVRARPAHRRHGDSEHGARVHERVGTQLQAQHATAGAHGAPRRGRGG